MCRQNSPVHPSGEEEIAADESLLIYCKPVELYNILYRRSLHNVILACIFFSCCIDFVRCCDYSNLKFTLILFLFLLFPNQAECFN